MKKFTLIFAMLAMVSIVATSQTLTWQFANVEVINAGTQFQFDVEVKANVTGTYHRDLQVYFDYNTAGFGSDIFAGGNITVTPLALMNTYYVLVNPGADNTSSKFAVITEASNEMTQSGSSSFFNEMPNTFTGLLRITIDILDNTETAGIAFDQTLMDGGQYYQSLAPDMDPIKYVEPCVYANNLLAFNLSSIYGTVTYENGTIMDNTTVTLYSGGAPVDVATSDGAGVYYFSGMADGAYTVGATTTKTWGGFTNTDNLLVKRYLLSLLSLTDLRKRAADVNASNTLSSSDQLTIGRRLLSLISSWPAPDYVFEGPFPGATVNGPMPVNLLNGLENNDFSGLCSGDVNGSHIP